MIGVIKNRATGAVERFAGAQPTQAKAADLMALIDLARGGADAMGRISPGVAKDLRALGKTTGLDHPLLNGRSVPSGRPEWTVEV